LIKDSLNGELTILELSGRKIVNTEITDGRITEKHEKKAEESKTKFRSATFG